YPNFIKLMDQLGVESEDSDMSFSVRCENTGLEYNGTSLNSLFAQRLNIIRPKFLFMVKDILRFNKQTVGLLASEAVDDEQTLGQFVKENDYSDAFVNYYIVPMGAAIWSASVEVMMDFPLRFFLKFFNNHGMLSVDERPQWRVIKGGSRSYIEPITQAYKKRIYMNTPIKKVVRDAQGVDIITAKGQTHRFDQVVFACHSDQALAMLDKPSRQESEVLGSIPYQNNHVVLHTDTRLMPKKKLAWASWNYHIPQRANDCAMVTYNMNILQNFDDAPETFLLTLNRSQEINPDKIIAKYEYTHPVFTQDGIKAQARHAEISGQNRTHYCGAYWFNGFHEDGVKSGLRVAEAFGLSL
ncbi:MAG: putative NAD/FAD-binding protein, partial [Oleiphilaceae bacterium]